MGFKKLNPHPIDEYIQQIEDSGLDIKKIYLTPNKTYTTVLING